MALIALAVYVGITVGMWGVNWYLHRGESGPKAPSPDAMDFVQAEIGAPIPYYYGTIRIDQPILAWHGNHRIYADALVPNLFTFGVDMLLILGTPSWDSADEPYNNHSALGAAPRRLLRWWYGDIASEPLNASGTGLTHGESRHSRIYLGGRGGGGELIAYICFHDGNPDQVICSWPEDGVSAPTSRIDQAFVTAGNINRQLVPGYRNQTMVAVITSQTQPVNGATWGTYPLLDENGFIGSATGNVGESSRVASMGFEVRSLGPLGDTTTGDANPAWVIYDLLCGGVWKLGFQASNIDLDSFQAAALTLFGEQNGCSLVIYNQELAPQIIGQILAQIDGVLFEDPATGKIKLKLIRNDYDVDTIPELNADNVIGRPDVQWLHWRGSANQVRLYYTNRERAYRRDDVIAQRMANAVGQDNILRTKDVHFPYCTRKELAQKLAARELAMISRPMMLVNIRVTREQYERLPGDAVKINLPQHNIVNKVFRVMQADFGQLGDGAIMLNLAEDVFDVTQGAFESPPTATNAENLLPLPERYLEQAPYYLIQRLVFTGVLPIGGAIQTVMGLCVVDGDAVTYQVDTITTITSKSGPPTYATVVDVPPQFFPTCATLVSEYSRTKDPYDQTGYLEITDVSSDFVGQVLPLALGTEATSEITDNLKNVILVCDANEGPDHVGNGEIMAFTRISDQGGGVYRLIGPWRGLLDTTPRTWPAGSRVYWLNDTHIGRRSHVVGTASETFRPLNGLIIGSGEEADDYVTFTSVNRMDRPLPLANVSVSGYELTGVQGVVAESETAPLLGRFKEITSLDGAVNVYGTERSITAGRIVRGDETGFSAEAGVTWDIYAQKMRNGVAVEDEVAIPDYTNLSDLPILGVLLGAAGHGELDIVVHSVSGGNRSWQSPRISISAPRYRDLMCNGSFDYNSGDLPVSGWEDVTGFAAAGQDTDSLGRKSTGSYLIASTAASLYITEQRTYVQGYKPCGLTALLTFYVRTFGGSSDTVTVKLEPLDDGGGSLASAETSGALTGPSTHWRRYTLAFDQLPPGTHSMLTRITQKDTGEDDIADVGITRVQLQIGQFSSQLLTNPSFDGNITGWSAGDSPYTTALAYSSSIPYASDNGTAGAAEGASASYSGLKQVVSVPTGFTKGTAVLTLATALHSTGTVGDQAIIEMVALDGGSSVLTSASETITLGTDNSDVWDRQRLVLELPDGVVSIQVNISAVRAGASTCGVMFDDLALRIHNHLDATSELDFDWSEPALTYADSTWQRFHLQRPELSIPMIWAGATTPSVQPSAEVPGVTHAWSDGVAHSTGWLTGFLVDDNTQTGGVNCYTFERADASVAVDLQSSDGSNGDGYGSLFATTEVLIVGVLMRTDEIGSWGGACGIVGRRGPTGLGWGLGLNASGQVVATIQGASGAATVTSSDAVNDGAPHWVFFKFGGDGTIKVITKAGTTSASAASIGSPVIAGIPFRIGRDRESSQTLPGQIARVYLWEYAVSDAALEAMAAETHAEPSGLLDSFTADQPVYVPGPPTAYGDTLVRRGEDTPHVCHDSTLGYGIAVTHANTNHWPSNDVTDATSWAHESGSSLTSGIQDATGLLRGVRCTVSSAGSGLRITEIAMTSESLWVAQLWLRLDVAANITIDLLNGANTVVDSVVIAGTTTWKRHIVEFTWDNSTANAHLRLRLSTGTGYIDCSHVGWFGPGSSPNADVPLVVQDALASLSDCHGAKAVAMEAAQNYRGEIYIKGRCLNSNVVRGRTLASTDNGTTDLKNARTVSTETVPDAVNLTAYSGDAGTPGSVEANVGAWDAVWEAQARWNTLILPEDLAGNNIGVVVDGSTHGGNSHSLVPSETGQSNVRIGGGSPNGTTSCSCLIQRVLISCSEPKVENTWD